MRQLLYAALLVTLLPVLPASAQVDSFAPMPTAAAGIGSQIGVAGAVRGSVQVSDPGAVGQILRSGQPIFLGQTISTGPDAGLQILLLDETVFTIGPNSSIAIDEFVYDPRSHDGKVSARVVKGAFRFITGKIARKHPEDMEVELPAGTIGIRGTIAAGLVSGLASSVVLLGPGPKNNTGDPPGKVTVGNAGQDVALTRPGFGTRIDGPNSTPAPAFQFSAADLEQISGALAPEAEAETSEETSEQGESEGSASDEAGQTTAEGLGSLLEIAGVSDLAENLEDASNESTQTSANTTNTVADGTATLDQLRTIQTGVFHYVFGSDPGTPGIGQFTQTVKNGSAGSFVGNLTGEIDIDFGARTIGGGESFFGADTTAAGGNISGEVDFPSHSFASGGGNATFTSTVSSFTGTFTVNVADVQLIYATPYDVDAGQGVPVLNELASFYVDNTIIGGPFTASIN